MSLVPLGGWLCKIIHYGTLRYPHAPHICWVLDPDFGTYFCAILVVYQQT